MAWAILNGEQTTGVSIIQMSPALDAGAILAQEATEIYPGETAGELESRLAIIGARLTCSIIEQLKQGPCVGRLQDQVLVSRAPKLTKESGAIAWHQPAHTIARHILAMQPWPTAYTFLHRAGKPSVRIMVTKTGKIIAASGGTTPIVPGSHYSGDGNLWVFTGNQEAIQILELQPAGKKKMSADDFLRGHWTDPQDRFGPENLEEISREGLPVG